MSDKKNQSRGFSRRHFLKGIAGGTVATVIIPGLTELLPGAAAAGEGPAAAKIIKTKGLVVRLHGGRLPILRKADVDVLVIRVGD